MKNLKPGTSKSSSFYRHKVAELYTNRRGDQFKMQIKLLRPERRCFWGMHPSSRWKVLTLISQTNPEVARPPNHHQSLVGLEQERFVFCIHGILGCGWISFHYPHAELAEPPSTGGCCWSPTRTSPKSFSTGNWLYWFIGQNKCYVPSLRDVGKYVITRIIC